MGIQKPQRPPSPEDYSNVSPYNMGAEISVLRQTWVPIPALALTSGVALAKPLNFSELQPPPLWDGDNFGLS